MSASELPAKKQKVKKTSKSKAQRDDDAAAVPALVELPEAEEVDVTFGTVDSLSPNVRMCMRTLQSAQWRSLIDALKDLVPECPVKFSKEGMKLIALDPAHVALVHLHAMSEFYYCKEEEIIIGLNVCSLYKMLRNLTTGGFMLEFMLLEDDPDHFHVIVTNSDKRTCTRNKLKLMRLPEETIFIPETTFNRVLSIPSTDFQRYVRELSAISDKITIRSTKDMLILSAEGTCGSTSIEIRPTASGLHWSHINNIDDKDEVVEGVFLSKYLERFSKPLDITLEIFIKDAYPIVMRYVMPTATIRLVIASLNEEDDA
jgi:proliferating cell nuclear antigen